MGNEGRYRVGKTNPDVRTYDPGTMVTAQDGTKVSAANNDFGAWLDLVALSRVYSRVIEVPRKL
jgi:hypothetical protein